jgi:CheY-like chemotaxis protein
MRVLVCDDDAHLRVVLRSVIEERGHEVVGEADMASQAIALVRALKPDAAVVDLALRSGSGNDVVRYATDHGCRVVVFSAFLESSGAVPHADAVVAKPDFAALETALDALSTKSIDRKRWRDGNADRRAIATTNRPPPAAPVEDPAAFYRALGDAIPGDVVMFVDVDGPADEVEALGVVLRGVIRGHDHVLRRGNQFALLLVDAQPEAANAVAERLRAAWDATAHNARWTSRHAVATLDESPAEAFQRLRDSGSS